MPVIDVILDAPRVDYFAGYLNALVEAVAEGVDVRGYMAWSLLDNFEWADGYSCRFGVVHVDYKTLVRTPKDSFMYLKKFFETSIAK
jgi:beta-glucosidase/6-phospho-beta-glucosidase/beta-galactosidase